MKKYSILKPSGNDWLGAIPEGWEMKRLKYISYTRVSNVDKKSEDEIQVKLCNYMDVYKNEFITEKTNFMIATATKRQVDAFELKKGDVIITKDSETPDDIGIAAYVDLEDTKNVVCGYHLAISTPTNSVLLGKYLFRLFQSNIFRSYFAISSNGITRYGLGTYAIYNANILLPSFSEQCLIANFLDSEIGKIDDLISKKQKMIDLLNEEHIAIINQAVIKGLDTNVEMKDSGVEWLGMIPEHWKVDKIKHLFNHIKNPAPVGNNEKLISIYTATGVDLRENLEQRGNKSTTTDNYWFVKREDIIVNKLLAWMGAIGISEYEGVTSPAYDVIRVINRDRLNPYYYNYVFRLKNMNTEFKRYSKGILEMRLRLYFDKLGLIEVPAPPIEEQNKIVLYIKNESQRIDLMNIKIQKEIDLLQEYRTALISEVVTGKIDVRDEVVSWT